MVSALDEACHISSDPADTPGLVVSRRVRTGRPGRPRVEIDRDFLAHALELRGPQDLEEIFDCDARTIRRRGLEYSLLQPGAPVYEDVVQDDGAVMRTYTSSTPAVSNMTDDELDAEISRILNMFS